MEVIDISSKPPVDSKPVVLMIGKFDGIHKGHQAILETALRLKGEGESLAVMSFSEHPLWVLKQDEAFKRKITPDGDKLHILKQYGVERYYRIRFSKEYAEVSAEEFVLEHLSNLNVKRIVVGEGFRFGHGQGGGKKELSELCSRIGAEVTVIPLVTENGAKISSAAIRSDISNGHVEAAAALLNRPYSVTGIVIHGQKLGRKLGFPTINMGGVDDYVFPKPGVYVGTAQIHGEPEGKDRYDVLISAGYRPTVDGEGYLIEAFLLDFSGDLYDRTVTIGFTHYLRGEIKFTGLDALIEQMKQDEANARKLLSASPV
ncbi:bifunctional riboflavin kinase/FAD synthetase [Paenibacillus sp. VCA1]|uniref:bifunctional riboflavin kinase/FAD synthetase n=1 Tax=Paenibacillus sp. VCA1 TaxID=3039148 RepID=UPI00287134D5|nr:bifunctional riboflavin kinase/FAD synthetase [Paenibacillus sp. VCA1]MDR9854196.1 bifunctional riboflavin kinase/FAD synthetase [Paenibacillus sp. VCA1]